MERVNQKLAVVITKTRSHPPLVDDARDLALYSIADVARSLRMSPGTLAEWTKPRVEIGRKKETFRPLIQLSSGDAVEGTLSFYNIIEAHILLATLRYHKIPILSVRRALEVVRAAMPSPHPLAEYTFKTKGKHLFLETLLKDGDRIIMDASQNGQRILVDVLDDYLERIVTDQSGSPFRLFPVKPGVNRNTYKPVMMDINFASGSLVVTDTGIRASVLLGRFRSGHTIERLSRDYHLSREQIQGAIEYFETAA